MRTLHIDIETYSPEPLADAGLYRYSESPGFELLLVAYGADEDPTRILDLASGDDLPEWFVSALTDPAVRKAAHNAAFERVCLTRHLRRLGRLADGEWLDPAQWHCTMVQCSRCGLPLSLAEAGAALGLPEQKMAEGRALIKLFCTPQESKAGGLFSGANPRRVLPDDAPDKWETFKAYCIRDVDVERQIDKATQWYPVPDFERRLYVLDQRINDRGALLDMDLVRSAIRVSAVHNARLTEEAMRLTGLANPGSVKQLRDWLSGRLGIELESLTKADLADLAGQAEGLPDVRRVLQIRAETGKTSVKKYETMRSVAGADGRARGLLQFCGSHTGRWAGRLIQVQNLPQNHLPDLGSARDLLKAGDTEMLELGYGNVADTLSQLIRTAFIAPPGKTLAVCDFSAIEARALAWLSGEEWVLDTFRKGGDIYCATASQMFHVPVEKHGRNAELRQKGKIAVLALGYGGGAGALDAMGGQRLGMTLREEQETVTRWRRANPNIVAMWRAVEDAAASCAMTGEAARVGPLGFAMHGKSLTIALPSGRLLCYPGMAVTANRFGGRGLEYMGTGQKTGGWGRVETHGGKLTENITQAVARDCLADALTRAEDAGIPVVFHVHDELICETTEDRLADLEAIFAATPGWAPGLPLKGAGYTTPYYRKD